MTPSDLAAIQPATAVGRLVLERLTKQPYIALADPSSAIRTIESAAWDRGVTDERARIRAAVEGLDFMVPRLCDCHRGEMRHAQEPDEYRAAVLRAIEGER